VFFFFFSSRFIFRLFILFLASIHHRISFLLLFFSFSHTVNQSLYILLCDHVQQSIDLLPNVMFCTLVVRSYLLSFIMNKTNRTDESIKLIICMLNIHCLGLRFVFFLFFPRQKKRLSLEV
jgi:hypothetical protein